MNPIAPDIQLALLPRLGYIDTNRLWDSIPMAPIHCDFPLLDYYIERHERWTEKIRIIGLDSGILVDYRLMPGLDRLVDHLCGQCGWARPEVFVVSDIGRKGVDGWSAVSVVSRSAPIILLGTHLVEALGEVQLAFVIGHEIGHLFSYTDEWYRQTSMSFLIREHIEGNQTNVLQQIDSTRDWEGTYNAIMYNARAVEIRCDRLGLLMCGSIEDAARALLTGVLKSPDLAKRLNLYQYLLVQLPLLSGSPAAGPFSVNAGHPFVPYRLKSMADFVNDGSLERALRSSLP